MKSDTGTSLFSQALTLTLECALTFAVFSGAKTRAQVERLPHELQTIQNQTSGHGQAGCATCTAAARAGLRGEGDGCTFDTITNECKIFDPSKGPKIQYPDGTFIPNFTVLLDPLKVEAKANSPEAELKLMAQVSANDRMLFSFEQELEGIAGLSPFLKLELIRHLDSGDDSIAWIFGQGGTKGQKGNVVSLPWPPTDPNASLKLVSAGTVNEYLQKTLKPAEFQKLSGMVTDYLKKTAGDPRQKAIYDDPTFQDLKKVTPERQKHVNELVEYVRREIESQIRGGRDDSQLTVDELNAIASVKSIKPKGFDDVELQRSPTCNSPVPNAYYSPVDHTINLCQNFYNFPDATIVAVLGHEMTHSFDPCEVQSDLYSIDPEKLQSFLDPQTQQPIPAIAKDQDLNEAFETLEQIAPYTTLTKYPFELQGIKPAALSYFEKMGVLKALFRGEKSLTKYVLGDVYSCLISDAGGKFRSSAAPAEIKKIVTAVVDLEARNAIGPFDKVARARRITSAFSRFPECVSADAHSQMGEAMADWMGTRVLGAFLKGKKLVTPEDKLATVGFFATLGCSTFHAEQAIRNDPHKGPADVISQVLQEYKGLADEHPSDKTRVNKIFLRDSNVRTALGCDPNENGCVHKGQHK